MTFRTLTREGGVPVKAWVDGVVLDPKAEQQLLNVASLPFVFRWVAAMPDVHWGLGATIGSVIPTEGAIIPAAVGVDIGCGMMALRTSLKQEELPDDLRPIRRAIENAVPHGRTDRGGRNDRGCFGQPSARGEKAWRKLKPGYEAIIADQPSLDRGKHVTQLATLGTGNHFIEVCLDESGAVWVMLHSGSRGVGNRIGMHFISLARKDMERQQANLPDKDLAYLEEGSEHYEQYVRSVDWAQRYARVNRELMMEAVLEAMRATKKLPKFKADLMVVNCHHNYVARETHFDREIFVTRKGAVRAGIDDFGIIPGSMGARSYIVRGKGNPESFESCSHGAGRALSRTQAKKKFTVEDHIEATRGVECRKDEEVIDETPAAYKPIEAVMAAQRDLVDVVHTLKQVICVKG